MRRKKKPSSRSVNPLRHKGAAGSRVTETPSPIYARIRAAIRQIPRGKVSTYGAVARAAGFPGAARQVARALHSSVGLPWQRVLGSGGQIKLRGDSAMEQRFRLEAEGVRFRGKKVDMKAHEFRFAKKRSK
ncbi:MAG TPA: MGMT family protein [Terriglobales bacterium]|jgi:methylated-DNA-protein-cysteine methyltransferase-like protein